MANNRVFWAIQQAAFRKTGSAAQSQVFPIPSFVLPLTASGVNDGTSSVLDGTWASGVADLWEVPRGVQSVGITTNYNLEQIFELGQIEIYENIQGLPDVEITVERVLDGTMPLYLIASDGSATDGTLNSRNASYQTDIAFNIYPDVQTRATGNAESMMLASGCYLSSVTYAFPVDGNFTESVTFVGNDKYWVGQTAVSGYMPSGVFFNSAAEDPTVNVGLPGTTFVPPLEVGVARREQFNINEPTAGGSRFPGDIPGVAASGGALDKAEGEKLQTVNVSTDLGREDIFCLGQKGPYYKYIAFPIEVTSSFEVITNRGDLKEASSTGDNLTEFAIELRTDSGLVLNLGSKNKLSSIDLGGGQAGGGNMTVTYNYTTFNDLTISHLAYPNQT